MKRIIATAALAGALLITTTASTFADGKTQEPGNKKLFMTKSVSMVGFKDDLKDMPLDQRKAKMIERFTNDTNKMVESGELTKEQGDKLTADFKAKVEKWDGNGPLTISLGGPGKKIMIHNTLNTVDAEKFKSMIPEERKAKMLEGFKTMIDKRVQDGEITREEGDKLIENFKSKPVRIEVGSKLEGPEKGVFIKRIEGPVEGDRIKAVSPEDMKADTVKHFTEMTDKRVEAGEITREEGDRLIADFKAKVEKWDGSEPLTMTFGTSARLDIAMKPADGENGEGNVFFSGESEE